MELDDSIGSLERIAIDELSLVTEERALDKLAVDELSSELLESVEPSGRPAQPPSEDARITPKMNLQPRSCCALFVILFSVR
jgi:hypothetical protein